MTADGGADLKVGVTGGPGAWVGVLRGPKRRVLWSCGHTHVNRDMTTTWNVSARDCAAVVLDAIQNDDRTIRKLEQWLERACFSRAWERDMAVCDLERRKAALEKGRALRGTIAAGGA